MEAVSYTHLDVYKRQDITSRVDAYLSGFEMPRLFDESTVRKKLKEYVSEGIVIAEKRGKTMYYSRAEMSEVYGTDVLDFFSEVSPCGVIGSFLLDKGDRPEPHFAYKHHYMTGALDSEILCRLFMAMREKRMVTLETINRNKARVTEKKVIPLRIMFSAQSGRQYLMAYSPRFRRITPYRTCLLYTSLQNDMLQGVNLRHSKLSVLLFAQ